MGNDNISTIEEDERVLVEADSRGRFALGALTGGRTKFLARVHAGGVITLEPAVVLTQAEFDLARNPQLAAQIDEFLISHGARRRRNPRGTDGIRADLETIHAALTPDDNCHSWADVWTAETGWRVGLNDLNRRTGIRKERIGDVIRHADDVLPWPGDPTPARPQLNPGDPRPPTNS